MFDRHHNKGSHMYIKIRNYSLPLIILGICLLLLGGRFYSQYIFRYASRLWCFLASLVLRSLAVFDPIVLLMWTSGSLIGAPPKL